jgi:hypothetical protein
MSEFASYILLANVYQVSVEYSIIVFLYNFLFHYVITKINAKKI